MLSTLLVTKIIADVKKGEKVEVVAIGEPGVILYISENHFYDDIKVTLDITIGDSTLTLIARYHKRPTDPDDYLELRNADYLRLNHLAQIFFLLNDQFLNHLGLDWNNSRDEILEALQASEIRVRRL